MMPSKLDWLKQRDPRKLQSRFVDTLKTAKGTPPTRLLKEFRVESAADFPIGSLVLANIFSSNELVTITGKSKGRGFAGFVKRHGFGGGRATHGSMFHRAPGSIGASAFPSRVFKGSRMAGHMGNKNCTVKKSEDCEG